MGETGDNKMVKTEQFRVGAHEYSVTQWNATYAMIMKLKLGKYLGGLAENITENSGNMANTMLANIKTILNGVNIEEFVGFIKEVACSAARDGVKMNTMRFDEYFNGELMEAYEVAFKVLEVNYKDFLVSVLSLRNGK
jgi:hypothetical protein